MSMTPHTVDEEWVAAYSAGTLSPAKQLLLDCQLAIRPSVGEIVDASDSIGGALLETAAGSELSDEFERGLADRISRQPVPETPPPSPVKATLPDWMPAPLSNYFRSNDIKLKWHAAGVGVQRAKLCESKSGERLYLLKARPGLSIPAHGHAGEEWTLILSGGYHVGDTGYGVGDLHQENDNCTHSLRIDDDGTCISLVMDEGRLSFSNPAMKVLQQIFRL